MDAITANKQLILIVDSNNHAAQEVVTALMAYYNTARCEPSAAVDAAIYHKPALIIVSDTCPAATDIIGHISGNTQTSSIPVLFNVSAQGTRWISQAKHNGAADYIVKPYRRSALIKMISSLLKSAVENDWNALPEVAKVALYKSVEMFNTIADTIGSGGVVEYADVKESCRPLVTAVQDNDIQDILGGVRLHDDYTYAHSMRVATLLCLFGKMCGFSSDEQSILASGGLLHDVGKIKIPFEILNKPGKLTPDEYAVMKTHVPETMKVLRASADIGKAVLIIAEQHHEKLDGTGYPLGLKAAELNELARMSAIVDVFSALTDRRVYKPSMEPHAALKIMTADMPGHLDEDYIKIFAKVLLDSGVM